MTKSGRLSLFLVLSLLTALSASAANDPVAAARAHLESNAAKSGLTAADLSGTTLSDSYQTKHNGSHACWMQRHVGIVWNGIAKRERARSLDQ